MKTKLILIGAVSAVVITTAFAYTYRESPAPQTVSVFSGVATGSTSSPQATSLATFKVGDKTYPLDIAPNKTVIDAMRALASTGDFTFTTREYPGLGTFVDSINGQKGGSGMYWILYVNGATSANGVSATTLETGDVIEWKYEKGF